MAILTGVLLLFPVGLWSVDAQTTSVKLDEDNPTDLTNISDLLWQMPSSGLLDITGYYGTDNAYYRLRFTYTNSNSTINIDTPPNDLFILAFREYNQSTAYPYLIIFRTGYNNNDYSNHSMSSCYFYIDRSTDGISWSRYSTVTGSATSFTGTGLTGYSFHVSFKHINPITYLKGLPNVPTLNLLSGQGYSTILQVISYRLTDRPWGAWSNSSGGLHFPNGTSLTAQERSQYDQIFIVMDINHDNSVSEEEVNYYNVTYNTNYDYSEVNEGNNFTELQFLEYIALLLSQGVENPGGGSGEGGGSGSTGGAGAGVYIGEGSFTQSQSQTIEENAVNVTVNNNNELSQENMQYLNNVINNNMGTEGNAFQDAISAISGFSAVARSFSGLVTVMFGFLPSWVLTIMGLMFTILFVFIVFRLIHLFI